MHCQYHMTSNTKITRQSNEECDLLHSKESYEQALSSETWTKLHLHSSIDPQSWASQHHHVCEEPDGHSAWKDLWLDMTAEIHCPSLVERYNNNEFDFLILQSFPFYFILTYILVHELDIAKVHAQNTMVM